MKNLIAISAAALTAAAAQAGFVNTGSVASWTTQGSNVGTDFPAGPGYTVLPDGHYFDPVSRNLLRE